MLPTGLHVVHASQRPASADEMRHDAGDKHPKELDVEVVAAHADHHVILDDDGSDAAKVELVGIADGGVPLFLAGVAIDGDQIRLRTAHRDWRFDSLYPALGSDINSGLAIDLGAARSEEGCLIVDAHQRTNIARLYAAGDVVKGLDQISHAMGEGGVASTTIRNDLAKVEPLLRPPPPSSRA